MVKDSVDTPVSDMAFRGDSLVFYGSTTDNLTGKNSVNYGLIDIKTCRLVKNSLIDNPSQIEMPYGIMLHPVSGDIYVMDAKNYVSSGKLFCFNKEGQLKWQT